MSSLKNYLTKEEKDEFSSITKKMGGIRFGSNSLARLYRQFNGKDRTLFLIALYRDRTTVHFHAYWAGR